MIRHFKYGFLLLIIIVFAFSCKKYEDGGRIAQTEKNITKRWILKKVYKDDIDLTSELVVSDFHEDYSVGGVMTRSYTSKARDSITHAFLDSNVVVVDYCNWVIDDFEPVVHISSTDTIYNFMNDTIRTKILEILKLDRKEFWYSFWWKTNGIYINYQFNFERDDF